ncbi:hypothetical protein Tco_1318596 [Tanacetum coccineum]
MVFHWDKQSVLISLNNDAMLHRLGLLTKPLQNEVMVMASAVESSEFGTLNELARKNVVRGLPILKYAKTILLSILSASSTVPWAEAETVHVAFDELTEGLTSVQTSSGLAPQQMTSVPNSTELELTALQSGHSHSALVKDPEPPSVPPNKETEANGSSSPHNSYLRSAISLAVTESLLPHQIPLPDTSDSDDETLFDHVDSNVFDTHNAPETASEASSYNSVNIDVTPNNQLPHVQKWTQAHPLENIIGDKDRPVSTRKQLETDAMWCFFNEFLTHVEPKTY